MTFRTNEFTATAQHGSGVSRLFQLASDWWAKARSLKARPKFLKLCESIPLGERRLVAVMEYRSSRFLIGATAGSIVLLATLPAAAEVRAAASTSHEGAQS